MSNGIKDLLEIGKQQDNESVRDIASITVNESDPVTAEPPEVTSSNESPPSEDE